MIGLRNAGLLAGTILLLGSAACGGDDNAGGPPAGSPSPAVTTASAIPSVTPSATPVVPSNTVDLGCMRNDATIAFTVTTDAAGKPDFAKVWEAKPKECEVVDTSSYSGDAEVGARTAVEQAAYDASGYDDLNIATLYELCANVDAADVYIEDGFAMSPDQIKEVRAVMLLCPGHPFESKWKAAIKRGEKDAKLEADGRMFGTGTYRVGKEVKPGTYESFDVDGCYWARQNRNGGTIDNDFVTSAKRVQVTIRKGDYGFETRGCGTWKPVS
jgi:hypothetical protein